MMDSTQKSRPDIFPARVALCHDYLIKNGGAERVLQVLHTMFPGAPVYTLLYDEQATHERYKEWDIRTSWLQKAPRVKKMIDYYRALMPQAVESLDLSDYDLVISDSSSFIKGVITQSETLHVSYIHTPTRFLWFNRGSHIERGKFATVAKAAIPAVLHRIRQWDFISARRPDILIANSETTKKRIHKFYRQDSEVIYPPVDVARFDITCRLPRDYYLILSRLEPHKDIDVAIRACNATNEKLVIIGSGSHATYLQSIAGPTIQFVGELSDSRIEGYLYGAKALLAPQIEDFGITLAEALACGCPVIARKAGGAVEIVEDGKNGILIDEINDHSLATCIENFDASLYDPKVCRARAEHFSADRFSTHMMHIINNALKHTK